MKHIMTILLSIMLVSLAACSNSRIINSETSVNISINAVLSSGISQTKMSASEPILGSDESSEPVSNSEDSSKYNITPTYASIPKIHDDFDDNYVSNAYLGQSELWGKPIDLKYKIFKPNQAFLTALVEMGEQNYLQLIDTNNFFKIGDYLLFYVFDNATGYYKIIVEYPDGELKTVFQSTQVIYSLGITKKHKLMIKLVNAYHGDGLSSRYYLLDLLKGKLNLQYNGEEFYDVMSQNNHWYNGNLIISKPGSNAEGPDDHDFYNRTEIGDILLATHVPAHMNNNWFFNNKLYYKQFDGALFSVNIDGSNTKKVYNFDTFDFCQSYYIIHNKLFYYDENSFYISDLSSGLGFKIKDSGSPFFADEKGLYIINDDRILNYFTYDGKKTKILSNFKAVDFHIINDWIYFLTSHGESYYKVRMDGSGLKILEVSK